MNYSDQQIIYAILKCSSELDKPNLSVQEYEAWHSDNKNYPSIALIHRRVTPNNNRGWNAWKKEAGLPTTDHRDHRNFGKPKFSTEDIHLAIARIEQLIGVFPTLVEYDKAKRNNDPTSATLRHRSGTWNNVKDEYIEWKKDHCQIIWDIDIPN